MLSVPTQGRPASKSRPLVHPPPLSRNTPLSSIGRPNLWSLRRRDGREIRGRRCSPTLTTDDAFDVPSIVDSDFPFRRNGDGDGA